MTERKWKRPGKGMAHGYSLRIVVGFDDETFAEIRARALKSGRSMGAEIRELVEFGLMDAEA